MTALKRFLFDHDFNDEAEAPEPAPSPEPPADTEADIPAEPEAPPMAYTADDLEAARTESYQSGFDAGVASGYSQGKSEAETAATETARQALTAAAQAIGHLTSDLPGTEARRDREALDLAVALVRRLFPDLQRRKGLKEIESLITDTLHRLRETPRVVVRAHPETIAHLQERTDLLCAEAGFDGALRLLEDQEIPAGDVRVDWSDGSAQRDTATLWQQIDETLATIRDEGQSPGAREAAAQTAEQSAASAAQAEPAEPKADDETLTSSSSENVEASATTPDGRGSAETVRTTG